MSTKELLATLSTLPEDARVLVEEIGINDIETVEVEHSPDDQTYVILVAAH